MSWIHNEMKKDAQRILEQDLQTKFTWKGAEYFGSISYGTMTTEAEDFGGFADESDLTIITLSAYFTSGTPDIGDDIKVDDVIFTINSEPIVKADVPMLELKADRPDGTRKTLYDYGE